MDKWGKLGNDEELFAWCEANQKMSKTILCKECTYVQKYINGKYEKIDPPEDIEQTFSHHILLKNLILR